MLRKGSSSREDCLCQRECVGLNKAKGPCGVGDTRSRNFSSDLFTSAGTRAYHASLVSFTAPFTRTLAGGVDSRAVVAVIFCCRCCCNKRGVRAREENVSGAISRSRESEVALCVDRSGVEFRLHALLCPCIGIASSLLAL